MKERWIIRLGDEWYFSPPERLRDDDDVPPSDALNRRDYPSRREAIEALLVVFEGECAAMMRGIGRAKAMLRRARKVKQP